MNDNRFHPSRYKSLIIVLLVGLTSKVSAASILQSEIGTGFGVLETLNQFLLFPLATYQDLGIFLAIWAGFYYATKPILNEIMTGMLEVFPSLGDDKHSLSRNNTPDSVKKSVRGLSFVSGFVAAQYLGWTIGGLALIAIGGTSLAAIAVYMLWGGKGFYNELSGNSGSSSGSQNTATDGGITTDQLQGELNQAKNELREEIETSQTVEQKLNGLKHSNFEEAAQQFINDERLPNELRQEMRNLVEGFEDEEGKEMTLLEVLEDVENREESQLKEEYEIAELHGWVNNEINHVLQEERRFEEMSQQMEEQFEELSNEQDALLQKLEEAESAGNVEAIEELRKQLEMNKQQFESLLQESEAARQKLAQELTSQLGDVDSRLDQMESEISDVKSKESQTDEELSEAEKEDQAVMKEADNIEELFQQFERDIPKDAKSSSANKELMKDLEWMAEAAQGEDSILREAEDVEGREEQVEAEEEAADRQDRQREQEAMQQADNLEQLFERFENTVSERIKQADQAEQQSGQVEAAEVETKKQVNEVITELEELYEQLGNSNTNANQIYSQAQQALNQVDRSSLPAEDANRLGDVERQLFEALKDQGVNVQRMWK